MSAAGVQAPAWGTFDEIYQQYWPRVFRLLVRMTRSPEDAEELTQEVFVHVYQGLPRFQGRSDVYTWIYRIARNQCAQYLERRRRRLAHEMEFGEYLTAAGADSPDDIAERDEALSNVASALGRLPASHRRMMLLGPIQGRDYEELAGMLGTSRAAVKGRLHRARAALRREIADPAERRAA